MGIGEWTEMLFYLYLFTLFFSMKPFWGITCVIEIVVKSFRKKIREGPCLGGIKRLWRRETGKQVMCRVVWWALWEKSQGRDRGKACSSWAMEAWPLGSWLQRSIGICLGEASLGPGHYIIQNIPFYFQRLSCNIFKTHLAQIIIIIMPWNRPGLGGVWSGKRSLLKVPLKAVDKRTKLNIKEC